MMSIMLSDFSNPYTLNIFCDASIKPIKKSRRNFYDGCYGAIAIYNDQIYDKYIRISSNTTNNNSEIKAIKAGVELALKHCNNFRVINLFSDSQISLLGIRERILNWPVIDGVLYTKNGTEVQSQEVFIEIVYLIMNNRLRINLYHQKGHVTSTSKALSQAQHVFRCSNQIRGGIDINFIKYISKWNNQIDILTRKELNNIKATSCYKDPIKFEYGEFDKALYSSLVRTDRGAF